MLLNWEAISSIYEYLIYLDPRWDFIFPIQHEGAEGGEKLLILDLSMGWGAEKQAATAALAPALSLAFSTAPPYPTTASASLVPAQCAPCPGSERGWNATNGKQQGGGVQALQWVCRQQGNKGQGQGHLPSPATAFPAIVTGRE